MSDIIFDSLLELRALAAITATAAGTAKDTGPLGLAKAVFIVTIVSGTTPTLDLKIQQSSDNFSSDTEDLVLAPQITVVGEYQVYFNQTKRYIRDYHTVGGTTPSFTTQILITTKP
jgi:hypothetical protein